jgi:hypothetical protein
MLRMRALVRGKLKLDARDDRWIDDFGARGVRREKSTDQEEREE